MSLPYLRAAVVARALRDLAPLLLGFVLMLLTSAAGARPLALTVEERAWLDAHPTVRLGVDPDWLPFEAIDPDKGHVGMTAEVMRLFEARLGIRFEIAADLTWPQVLEAARAKHIDVVAALVRTHQREAYLRFTRPYLNFPLVIFTRAEAERVAGLADLRRLRVGVVRDYMAHEVLARDHPNLTLVPADSVAEALQALALGQTDAYVGELASASYGLRRLGLTNLRIAAHTPYAYSLAVGVRDDWPVLAGILDKTIAGLGEAELEAIQRRWVPVAVEPLPSQALLAGMLALAATTLLLAASVWVNRRLRREVAQRQHAEALAREGERRLLRVEEIAHVGGWEWRIGEDEMVWTDETYRILGLAPGAAGPSFARYLERVHPEDRDAVEHAVHTALRDGTAYRARHRIVRPNGEIRVVEDTGSVEFAADGRPERLLGVLHDVTERWQAEQRIHHLAHHDSLTGLANRLLLHDRLAHALETAARRRWKLALMFIDLDRFKSINDTLGHAAGDQLLCEAADRLRRCARASDTIARLGGDEFVVLLEGLDQSADATPVASHILRAFAAPLDLAGRRLDISASIGVVVYPDDGADVDTLMRNADTAMYQAKAQGRNNFQFFAPYMNEQAHARFEVETALRRALERDEFELYYQPLMAIDGATPWGVEALIRWRHPQRGLVAPDEFIPVAEDTGDIVAIGVWVLGMVCAQLAAWRAEGLTGFCVSVNLSPRQFKQPDLVRVIAATLAQYGIEPARVELEVTETSLAADAEAAARVLGELKALGCGLAVDDFGTGYSSLAYLKRFPIDRLKIDRSFVRDIEHDASDREITAAVIALSHNLGLRVVAEGVETAAQLDFLRARGCDFAQGWLFAPAMPAAEAGAYLTRALDGRGPVGPMAGRSA
jgi:diguanylate cyclase (GGDEF)-like protein